MIEPNMGFKAGAEVKEDNVEVIVTIFRHL